MNSETQSLKLPNYLYFVSLISGGVAGMVVDITLFPIDTLKTRLQSEKGLFKSGGFKGLYNGLAPAAAGSIPTAALFFWTYENVKELLLPHVSVQYSPFVHMTSASVAEVVACLIRVPVEIVKQRRQALNIQYSSVEVLKHAYKTEGIRKGIYRGFGSTLMREIPFSFIQFPLWEYFKANWELVTGTTLTSFSVAICGAFAGGIAAGITTPLDVIKTRIMLAERSAIRQKPMNIVNNIYLEHGIKGIFAGFVPRVLWITFGGAIFFGSYDVCSRILKYGTIY